MIGASNLNSAALSCIAPRIPCQSRSKIGVGVGVGIGVEFLKTDADSDPDSDLYVTAIAEGKPSGREY
jgi:hypothetical protein